MTELHLLNRIYNSNALYDVDLKYFKTWEGRQLYRASQFLKSLYGNIQRADVVAWIEKQDIDKIKKDKLVKTLMQIDELISPEIDYGDKLRTEYFDKKINDEFRRVDDTEYAVKVERIKNLAEELKGGEKVEVETGRELIDSFILDIDKPKENRIFTNLPAFEAINNGFPNGLHVIGGRPSFGKTFLALDWFVHWGIQGHKSIFFSYDDSRERFMQKFVARYTNIDKDKIRKMFLTDNDIQKIANMKQGINHNFYFVFKKCGIDKMKTIIESIENLEIVFIDFFQMIPHRYSNDKLGMLDDIINTLQTIANESGKKIFLLSQLKRTGQDDEATADIKYTYGDLKGTGQLEAAPIKIIMVEGIREGNTRRLNICKNKDDGIGKTLVNLNYGTGEVYE